MTKSPKSNRCPEIVLEWNSRYPDGGLSGPEKKFVEAHAEGCVDCRAELDIVTGAPYEIDSDLPDPDRVLREIIERINAGGEVRASLARRLRVVHVAKPVFRR